MKRIRVETVLLVFMFAVMTFFFIVMINQAKKNDINNLYFNNFYSQNAVRLKITKSQANYKENAELHPEEYSGDFVFYNALDDKLDAAYKDDKVRVVFTKGDNFPKPYIIAGRFFTEEDIKSEEPLCVLGMTSFNENVTSEGYYYYHDAINGRIIKCRLIGVMGMKDGAASDVDSTVMINWNGYYNGIDNATGTFYIDSGSKHVSDRVFEELKNQLENMSSEENTYTAAELLTVGNIRSFSYFTYYLFILGSAILTICIIMLSLRYCDSQSRKTAIKKLCGYSGITVYFETTALIVAISLAGLIAGTAATALLRISVEFRYSETGYYTDLSPELILTVCAAVIVYSFAVAVFPSLKAYSTDTSEPIK